MGLGAFGGGEGVVRFLSDRGARITISDLKTEEQLRATLERLRDCRIETLHLGGHQRTDFEDAELIVVNPAVPRTCPWLAVARGARAPLTSEMNLFIEHNRGRVVAVTGSVGKSTTTSLIERMIATSGRGAWLGGNIGRSLLPIVDEIQPDDWVVLELSSFQLSDLDRVAFCPEVAVVTNLHANHLDWHSSFDEYRAAKQVILKGQRPGDSAVLNADDEDVARWSSKGRVLWFGQSASDGVRVVEHGLSVHHGDVRFEVDLRPARALPGAHNAMNAAAAVVTALAVGVEEPAIRSALESFEALPHRLRIIGECDGRTFVDDSKATTPESAIAALEAFEQPIVLLAGGADKQVDLRPFAAAIARRVRAAALMGQTAEALESLIQDAVTCLPIGSPPLIQRCDSFPETIAWAKQLSQPGDVILLSPGCASFGWFKSYVDRGEEFARLISRP
jgi:UDP-N-acetylmuramoylalanine--D-glutamate ligase